jgi:CHAT domain-containing protein
VTAAETQASLVPARGFMLVYQEGAGGLLLFVVPPAPEPVVAVRLVVDDRAAMALGVPAGPLPAAVLDKLLLEEEGNGGLLRRDLQRTAARGLAPARRLHALWRSLVPEGVWHRIRGAPEVVVVPDGSLHLLPFEALVVADPDAGDGVRYWLDEGPVVRYAPSATALASLSARRRSIPAESGAELLVVADPAFTGAPRAASAARGSGLEPLPGTAAEARAIRAAWTARRGAASVRTLEKEEAEERTVREALTPAVRFLHFATHGIVSSARNELLAALALAPPRDGIVRASNDGLLQLFEIYELQLDADLAVLSACGTHVGRLVRGEGAFALSRGFLAAGARRAVASLWPVSDDSTSVLMATFYRRVAETPPGHAVDYARALRDARREVRGREEWAAPFFWGPFVVSGLP